MSLLIRNQPFSISDQKHPYVDIYRNLYPGKHIARNTNHLSTLFSNEDLLKTSIPMSNRCKDSRPCFVRFICTFFSLYNLFSLHPQKRPRKFHEPSILEFLHHNEPTFHNSISKRRLPLKFQLENRNVCCTRGCNCTGKNRKNIL